MQKKVLSNEHLAREELHAAAQIIANMGLVNGHGHLSIKLHEPGGEVLVATPRNAPSLVSPPEMIAFSTDEWEARKSDLPVELPLHRAIYSARQSVRAIVRMHGPQLDAISTRMTMLPIVHGRGSHLRSAPMVFANPSPISTLTLADEVSLLLGEGNAVFLRGNGAVTVGADIFEAVANASYLLETAQIHLAGGLTSQPLNFTPQELKGRSGMRADSDRRTWNFLAQQYGGGILPSAARPASD